LYWEFATIIFMNDVLVILPTYNESENIEAIINAINTTAKVDILIVDDKSPDKTYEIVQNLQQKLKNLHLIIKEKKNGLGRAYLKGFKYAIEKNYKYIMQMDADFSHDPKHIPEFLKDIENNDLIIGSRYIKGITVVNWALGRILLSYFAGKYVRLVTGLPIMDPTGGFKCIRVEKLKEINLDKIKACGYSFQVEVTHKLWKKAARIKEIPIIFVDRQYGDTKMSKSIVIEAIWMVWKLKFWG
jgi:dolichol-phosphate mannosyltransferase